VAETCSPFDKPLLTPYYRKESCDLTVINKAYIFTLHNGMDSIKLITSAEHRMEIEPTSYKSSVRTVTKIRTILHWF
jgi:hypothetical protein